MPKQPKIAFRSHSIKSSALIILNYWCMSLNKSLPSISQLCGSAASKIIAQIMLENAKIAKNGLQEPLHKKWHLRQPQLLVCEPQQVPTQCFFT